VIAIALAIGVLGLLIGSFLNVVVYRVPLGKSIVSPPSACPGCGTEIRPYDNIPVLSWILLRGKCRTCKEPISIRYPLVELATGVLFFVVALLAVPPLLDAPSPRAAVAGALVIVAYLYFVAISVALALIDLDVHKLPNVIVLPSYVVALVLFGAASIISGDFAPLVRAVIAMAALAIVYFLMVLVYPGGMGMGDVKLAGVLGIYLGWVGWGPVFVGALAAFILGGVFGIILMLVGRATRKTGIPFGPWMLVGAGLGIIFGSIAFEGYLSIFGLAAA
jgi:leader peptidase (prepilin peptidase)/N-methyltransferase